MNLSFELSMPGVNSWNGKWSGANRNYVIVKSLGAAKKTRARLEPVIAQGYFSYNFGDGWCAGITVKEVDGKQARALRKASQGFCGYAWMVDEILLHGRIRTLEERQSKVRG